MTNENFLTAENSVIGACLADPVLWHMVLDQLHRDDLYSDFNRKAYDVARRFDLEGKEPPLATDIADAGVDRSILFGCMEVSCAARDLDRSIELVKKEARRRALVTIGRALEDGALDGDEPEALIAETEKRISALDERDSGQLMTGLDIAAAFYDFRDQISGKIIKTGLKPIDDTLGGGMLPGGFYILAARPGCGKTALALQIADGVAKSGAVLFVTLEMDVSQLQARRLSRRTGISSTRLLLDENLSAEEWQRVKAANVELSHLPLYANKREGCTVLDVRTMARHVKGLRLIVVDYLGLLRPERSRSSRYEEITAISNSLKNLARSLKVPVLCLAQLNRASEQRADKKPGLADLRDSGAIEQDADAVLLMHRPDMYDDETGHEDLAYVSAQIAKNRHAGTASFQLGFNLQIGRFVPVQERYPA